MNADDIKVEKVKIEPLEIQIEFTADSEDDIDETSPKSNLILRCEACNEDYEGYCSTCPMLIRIFHNVSETVDHVFEETIPKYILEIKQKSRGSGVFALKSIPKNAVFGPFNKSVSIQNSDKCIWKIINGKLIGNGNSICDNWMQQVNCAEDRFSSNLNIFQYKRQLYFRSNQGITAGEELLIWFGKKNISKSNNDEEECYTPSLEVEHEDVYACVICCLGFSTDVHLLKHKTACPYNILKDTVEEIVQCSICNIHLMKNEYVQQHSIICSKKNKSEERKNEEIQVINDVRGMSLAKSMRKTPAPRTTKLHKCTKCDYTTKRIGHLKMHLYTHSNISI